MLLLYVLIIYITFIVIFIIFKITRSPLSYQSQELDGG